MRKNSLIIFGSPHKNGTTAKLLHFFLKLVVDYDFKTINAFDLDIKPCIDCGFCIINQKCVYSDLTTLNCNFREADLLLIATPIYNLTFPAPLKTILDRTQKYYNLSRKNKNILEKPKKSVLLTVGGHKNNFGVKVIERQLRNAFFTLNTELIGTLSFYNSEKDVFHPDEFHEKNKESIDRIINKLR